MIYGYSASVALSVSGAPSVCFALSARVAPSASVALSVSGAPLVSGAPSARGALSASGATSASGAPLKGKANISAIILFWLLLGSAPGLAARFTFSTCKTAFMSVAAVGCQI